MEVEYCAIIVTIAEFNWVTNLLRELGVTAHSPIIY